MASDNLSVRIPKKLRDWLIEDSDQKGISLSDNAREILTAHCEKQSCLLSITSGSERQ